MTTIHLVEHEAVKLEDNPAGPKKAHLLARLEGQGQPVQELEKVRLMGMSYDFCQAQLFMNYYVGADWIDQSLKWAMVVTPKLKDIDFQAMLMKCFQFPDACKDFGQVLFIRTEDDPIEIDTTLFQVEPMLLIYFINMLQVIVRKGLRRDYIMVQEPLKAKIKGKILMSRYISQGIARNRKDTVPCTYQEYSINCLDNRILKAALRLSWSVLQRNKAFLGSHATELEHMYANAMAAFQQVDDGVTLQDLHRVHIPPVYKEYRQIMPLAKMIIRHQGFSVSTDERSHVQKFPPFIINMPILFERYVYALLLERYGKDQIDYQLATEAGIVDFAKRDEHLIIDTKYIPRWGESVNHENVRQLSGYARSTSIRRHLGVADENQLLPCLIVYPSKTGLSNFSTCTDQLFMSPIPQLEEIHGYLKFKKLSVKLPVK